MGDLQRVKRTSLRSGDAEDSRKYGGMAFVLLIVAGLAGITGWQFRQKIEVKRTTVSGLAHAAEADVIRLASIDTSLVLYDVDRAMVRDRVLRHPWIREVAVRRIPTGTLKISVAERHPVLMVIGNSGRPSHYLDAECYQMPMVEEHKYDVPLVSGAVPDFHPVKTADSESLCTLAAAVTAARSLVDEIVSEFVVERSGEITVYTRPMHGYDSVPVKLGSSEFRNRLRLLGAFWQQIVSERTKPDLKLIDLRYDSQVVTR